MTQTDSAAVVQNRLVSGSVVSPGVASEEIQPCWNQIGVYGDRSCKELIENVHCRNCPVYSHAGVQLLNRSMAPEYRLERTSHFSREKKLASAGKISALVFRVGPEWLSLPTNLFQEVAPRRLIHSLPHRRQSIVLGLVNIRGELLICVSLARLLGIESSAGSPPPAATARLRGESDGTGNRGTYGNSAGPTALARQHAESEGGARHDRLLVASWDDSRFAFPASEVHGIYRFDPQLLKEPPSTVAQSALAFSRGIFLWQDKTVGALDPDILFSALNRSLT